MRRAIFAIAVLLLGATLAMPVMAAGKTGKMKQELRANLMLAAMQADLLEAIEEAFAYQLLSQPEEKDDFQRKMADFDALAARFEKTGYFKVPGDERVARDYPALLGAVNEMQQVAEAMFVKYESGGKPDLAAARIFEERVDKVTRLYDKLMEDTAHSDLKRAYADNRKARQAIHLIRMQSKVLEAVEEAMAALLLNDKQEEKDFYMRLKDFDRWAKEFRQKGLLDDGLKKAFHAVLAARQAMETQAKKLFAMKRDAGESWARALNLFEEKVDDLTAKLDALLLDYMIAIAK
jgi:molybdenum-dependent DNA-binding transcriptional regulator ModE